MLSPRTRPLVERFTAPELALAAGAGCWLLGRRRAEWGLLLVLAGSFLVALNAAGKAQNYVFCVFPLVAVVVAALFLESGPALLAAVRPSFARPAAWGGLAHAGVLVASDAAKVARTLAGPVWVHPPVGVYEHLADDLERGRVRLVLYDFPGPDGCRRAGPERYNFEDLYYGPRMPLALRVRGVDELNALLAMPVPTIVLFPPLNSPQPPSPNVRPDLHFAEGTKLFPSYPLCIYHEAVDGGEAAAFTRLSRGLSAR